MVIQIMGDPQEGFRAVKNLRMRVHRTIARLIERPNGRRNKFLPAANLNKPPDKQSDKCEEYRNDKENLHLYCTNPLDPS